MADKKVKLREPGAVEDDAGDTVQGHTGNDASSEAEVKIEIPEDVLIQVKDELNEQITKSVDERLDQLIDSAVEENIATRRKTPAEPRKVVISNVRERVEDDSKFGFKSFGGFLMAVRDNPHDKRLRALREKALAEGTDSSGGYLVPTEFRDEVLKISLEAGIVRPLARVHTIAGDSVSINKIDETSRASNVRGGVLGYWIDEAGTATESTPKWGQIKLELNKFVLFTKCSNELLRDAPSVQSELTTIFGEAMGYFEDKYYFTGSGVGQPIGITNAGCLQSVSRGTATTFKHADAAAMYGELLPESKKKAVWIVNPLVDPQLLQIKIIGDSTKGVTVLGDIGGGPVATLFGRPIYQSEHCATLGTATDVLLCDFSHYHIADKGAMVVAMSEHRYFETDQVAWRVTIRIDGQPDMDSALTLTDGSGTVAPFVKLT